MGREGVPRVVEVPYPKTACFRAAYQIRLRKFPTLMWPPRGFGKTSSLPPAITRCASRARRTAGRISTSRAEPRVLSRVRWPRLHPSRTRILLRPQSIASHLSAICSEGRSPVPKATTKYGRHRTGQRLQELGELDDARTKELMKSSQLGQLDDVQPYGEVGIRLVEILMEWLASVPRAELRGLRSRLQAVFQKVRASRRVG